MSDVFINRISSYLPNTACNNDEIEEYLGLIEGRPSKVKNIVLKQNGIKKRYYALTKGQQITHTNAELAIEAIKKLDLSDQEVNLLVCATASPDHLIPALAQIVHGKLKKMARL